MDTHLRNFADPNMLARFAAPTCVNNFVDRLPTAERLSCEGFAVLVDPVSRLFDEASAEVGEGLANMVRRTQRLAQPERLAIEAGPKANVLALENGYV